MKRPILHFLYLLYIVETGVFLVLVPWSLMWVHSYFAQIPPLRPILLSGFVRGCVSAIGLIQIGMGAVDFLAFCRALKGPSPDQSAAHHET
jgi:hypothetical protein